MWFIASYKIRYLNVLKCCRLPFRAAHAYHLNTLLEQLLKDAGLSVDWKDTILPIVKIVSEQVNVQCRVRDI